MAPAVTDTKLAVLTPVLGRPQRVQPLIESLAASTKHERADGWLIRIIFICSAGDTAEIAAVEASGHKPMILQKPGRSEYPRKTNMAAELTDDDWLFLGADDLQFHAGWFTKALNAHAASGALVIGTNDLGNPLVIAGKHATHSLVHRSYVERGTIDEPGKILHDAYDHNACDVEFTETAMARATWVFAPDAIVEHLHPLWHRTVRRDPTYNKGIRYARTDRQLLMHRRHLWNPDAPRAPRIQPRAETLAGRRWPRR